MRLAKSMAKKFVGVFVNVVGRCDFDYLVLPGE
jgi:hypothetical protein